MSEPYNCPKCGLWCSGSANEHVCQDEQGRERIDELEHQVGALRTLVLKLWRDHYGIAEDPTQHTTRSRLLSWAAALRLLDEAE